MCASTARTASTGEASRAAVQRGQLSRAQLVQVSHGRLSFRLLPPVSGPWRPQSFVHRHRPSTTEPATRRAEGRTPHASLNRRPALGPPRCQWHRRHAQLVRPWTAAVVRAQPRVGGRRGDLGTHEPRRLPARGCALARSSNVRSHRRRTAAPGRQCAVDKPASSPWHHQSSSLASTRPRLSIHARIPSTPPMLIATTPRPCRWRRSASSPTGPSGPCATPPPAPD